ncbi:hypothetical protein KV205_00440 [Streptomyces sp. SKN60]|uniref:hypothetical protein n=1 Tax=Streptomyces sp. SKN60 TaxID=2855506 RepID=UPI002247F98E|nr:hypothetical protein [Streptomyces sp. SKN60]MCX2179005.1 hypothetical protein [Streptomyces sp. SKN60]
MSGNKPTGPPPGRQRGQSRPSPSAPSPRRKILSHAAAALGGLLVGVLIGVVGSRGDTADSPSVTQTVTATPQTTQTPETAGQPTISTPKKDSTPTAEIPGDGVFLVGKDIQPGTYRSDGKDNVLCYWARLSDTTGELGDIIASGNAEGQAIVKIDPSDKAFQSSDCKSWQKIA